MRPIDNSEYETLRDEMLAFLSFCRNILYWASVLTIVAVGWFYQQSTPPEINFFIVIGLFALIASFSIYEFFMAHIYWIGSYLAVFWERRESPDRRWHRFSRDDDVKMKIPLRGIPSFTYIILGSAILISPL
ncbi:hypothetical protein ACFLQ0_06905, partial [Nitrospinota bacterium]